jgi:hypothetical protein
MLVIRSACRNLFGISEGKKPLARCRCRWEASIKLGIKEVKWEGVYCIHVSQDGDKCWAIVFTLMNTGMQKTLEISKLAEKVLAS